jgi:hypothetical protein
MNAGKFPTKSVDEAESITKFSSLIFLGSIPDRVSAAALRFSTLGKMGRYLCLRLGIMQPFRCRDGENSIMGRGTHEGVSIGVAFSLICLTIIYGSPVFIQEWNCCHGHVRIGESQVSSLEELFPKLVRL